MMNPSFGQTGSATSINVFKSLTDISTSTVLQFYMNYHLKLPELCLPQYESKCPIHRHKQVSLSSKKV